MKKLKPTKPPNPDVRHIVITLRVNAKEMRELLARAHGFTGGSISEWMRFSALNHKPLKSHFEK